MSAAPPPAAPRRRPPWGLLALAVVLLGIAGIYLIAPESARRLAGRAGPAPPPDLGASPAEILALDGPVLAERGVAPLPLGPGEIATAHDAVRPLLPSAADPDAPLAIGVDEARATSLLREAEDAYGAMAWDRAASAASRIVALRCLPETASRASAIARGAPQLKLLFQRLDDRDELSRNWETHPSAVTLSKDGSTLQAVPITSLDDPVTPVEGDPLAWIAGLRASPGSACFLVKGVNQYTRSQEVLAGYTIERVDQAALAVGLGRQLDRMLARIGADPDLRADPRAWYEAGRFAYRNRLDARVTAPLDRAVQLDPDLCRTVREGNAAALFGAMVAHLKQGNRKQADIFFGLIDRRYRDTHQAELARLYLQGRTAELVATARAATPPAANALPAPVAPAANLAESRRLAEQGLVPYCKAAGMEATDERNRLYREAWGLLRRAKAGYAAWCEAHPGDLDAASELQAVGAMEAAVRKYLTW